MPQIFHRSLNTLSRITLAAAGLAAVVVAVSLYGIGWNPLSTRAKMVRRQPIPFSHAHHVGDLGIDCRYCHTTVETSAFAGMPSSQVCMNCHQEIWFGSAMLEPVRESFHKDRPIAWQRVHELPEFVYFNHAVHVHKGVGCVECHGRVDRMPLTYQDQSLLMSWCLSCHRRPGPHLRPRDEVFSMTWKRPADATGLAEQLMNDYRIRSPQELTSCSVCHR